MSEKLSPNYAAAGGPVEDRERIPRVLVRAVGAIMLICLLLVSYARLTGRPLEAAPANGPVAQSRMITVEADRTGAALVYAEDGGLIAALAPDEGGFVSGVWRSLDRERAKYGAPLDAPAELIRFEDGRLALRDPVTGWRVELMGFGRDNAAAFARLLHEQ